jgi:hypothetical protein
MTRARKAPKNATPPTIIPMMGPRPKGGREAPLLGELTGSGDDVPVGGGAFEPTVPLTMWVLIVVGSPVVIVSVAEGKETPMDNTDAMLATGRAARIAPHTAVS